MPLLPIKSAGYAGWNSKVSDHAQIVASTVEASRVIEWIVRAQVARHAGELVFVGSPVEQVPDTQVDGIGALLS